MQEEVGHCKIPQALVACYQVGMELNLRIREFRQAQKLTLAELADKVGVSTPHLSGVERGVKNLNNHLLVRIANALRVSPDDLIASDDRSSLSRLHADLRVLSPEDRKRVEDFAAALAQSAATRKHS